MQGRGAASRCSVAMNLVRRGRIAGGWLAGWPAHDGFRVRVEHMAGQHMMGRQAVPLAAPGREGAQTALPQPRTGGLLGALVADDGAQELQHVCTHFLQWQQPIGHARTLNAATSVCQRPCAWEPPATAAGVQQTHGIAPPPDSAPGSVGAGHGGACTAVPAPGRVAGGHCGLAGCRRRSAKPDHRALAPWHEVGPASVHPCWLLPHLHPGLHVPAELDDKREHPLHWRRRGRRRVARHSRRCRCSQQARGPVSNSHRLDRSLETPHGLG